jgi:hypothetical protein
MRNDGATTGLHIAFSSKAARHGRGKFFLLILAVLVSLAYSKLAAIAQQSSNTGQAGSPNAGSPQKGAKKRHAGGQAPSPSPSPSPSPALLPASMPSPIPNTVTYEIELGEMFERQNRLTDAEKAYAKALETATGTDRDNAKKHLENVFRKEKSFQEKYMTPSVEKANSGFWEFFFKLLAAILSLLVLWFLGKIIKLLGEQRGKNRLQIVDFIDATGEGSATALAEHMKNAIDQMQEYYKPRDRFRFGSFSSLLVVTAPSAEGSIELVTEVISSTAGKFVAFFKKGFFRPEYKISGMVQKTGAHYSCWVKLFRRDDTLCSWEKKFRWSECPELQEQLVFEVALKLREIADAHRD